MVLAYWLIGREIVEEIQRGKGRAKYGEKVVERLSRQLTERYGQGFSVTNIWYFKQFYVAFQDRFQIPHPLGGESLQTAILHPTGRELAIPYPMGTELVPAGKSSPAGSQKGQGFSTQLSWSHYRALMRVESRQARDFYEREAVAGNWDKRTLERQIQSFCELTHADVGQMDGYVRIYDGLFAAPDDNPTIGLILCTEKNETVARYSVLNDRKQIFASKYMLCLPTEERLQLEVEKERRLIEAAREEHAHDRESTSTKARTSACMTR